MNINLFNKDTPGLDLFHPCLNSLNFIPVYNCIQSSETTVRNGFSLVVCAQGGEEGQPHQSLVRTTFSSFSRPNHIEILVLSILFF